MLFWVALLGAVLALVAAWRGQREYAYAPAITLGLAVHGLWPTGTAYLLGL
jgi:hypothetical protein